MRINLNIRIPETQTDTRADKPGSTPARSEGSGLPADQAELSMDQGKVQRLAASVSVMPEVRTDKVQALQAAVQDGRYDVSAEQIADAMFNQLLARSSRLP